MSEKEEVKRFRIFAGPNGSGKSTIINEVRSTVVEGYKVDCGIYINADDIAIALANNNFSFNDYQLNIDSIDLMRSYAIESGLLRENFTVEAFDDCCKLEQNCVELSDKAFKDNMAQLLSNFMVEQLLNKGIKCSMETVFSHESKVKLLLSAKEKGYKVYLYFIATEDPEINKERVKARVKKGGHDVPPETIEKRYYKSLELLHSAAQAAYRCYFFDNSGAKNEHITVTHFKCVKVVKEWNVTDIDKMPEWFVKYYINKRNLS